MPHRLTVAGDACGCDGLGCGRLVWLMMMVGVVGVDSVIVMVWLRRLE